MLLIRSLLIIGAGCAAALAAPANILEGPAPGISGPSDPILDRPFYFLYKPTESPENVKVIDGPGSSFEAQWNISAFICGKGWKAGGARNITYGGTFNPNGNAYAGVYGWTTNPMVEYFVVDSFATRNNPAAAGQHQGTLVSDNSTYTIYKAMRYNQPDLNGATSTFVQYWSVRQRRRFGGTVTMQNHFDAWRSKGLQLGQFQYQTVALQAYYSKGSARVYFDES